MKKQIILYHPSRSANRKDWLFICLVFLSVICLSPVSGYGLSAATGTSQKERGKQLAVVTQSELSAEKENQTQSKVVTQPEAQEKSVNDQENNKSRKESDNQTQEVSPQNKNKTIKDWLEPWKKTLELSYVVTGGNTVTSSFSLGSTLLKTPNEHDSYLLKTFFLRTHSTTINQKAVGSEDSFNLIEDKTRKLTAENYLIQAQYDHRPSGRLLTNLGFSWDRNKFAGVEGRALWTAGAGVILADSDSSKIKTSGGLSLTVRKYSGQSVSSFLGFQYVFSWKQKLLDNSSFETVFVFDDNIKHLGDWHYDWTTSLIAPLTKSLALKASVRIMKNNRPPKAEVPLYSPDNLDTGLTVLVPRQKVDTFFTTTIVLNF